MPDHDFASTPYDASHPVLDPSQSDWRSGSGILDDIHRQSSYGNFAGPGNRILTENADYVAQQRALNPNYNETSDPKFASDPRYQPVDGLDAAAEKHDGAYDLVNHGHDMFTWDGMKDYHAADQGLVTDVSQEMSSHGDQYTDQAKSYAHGLQGFFGARVAGVDAVDWAENTAGQAESGIGNFLDSAKSWSSVGDAASGIEQGAQSAGSFLSDAASQAWSGASSYVDSVTEMGVPGEIGAVLGMGDVAVAGAAHVASEAWNGAASVGSGIADGASSLLHMAEDFF